MTGKIPTKKAGALYNKIRQYARYGSIAKDGLLVIKKDNFLKLKDEAKEKIVVPSNIAPGLLFHLHYHEHFDTSFQTSTEGFLSKKISYMESLEPSRQTL